MLTSAFFLGKPTGRCERGQHEVMFPPDSAVPVSLAGMHGMAGGGLLPAPPHLWCPPGNQGEEDRFSCGHVFFGRENRAGKWGVKGAWGRVGLADGGVLLEPRISQHCSQQLTRASPPASNLAGL